MSRHLFRAMIAALTIAAASLVGLAPAATAAETRTISGVVSLPGGPDAVALDAVKVFVKRQGQPSSVEVNVTSSGAFSISGLEPGLYEVCGSPQGYTKDGVYQKGPFNVVVACFNTVDIFGTRGTLDVTSGDLTGQTLALPWGLTISGTVSLPAGADPEWLRGVEAYSQMNVTGGFVGGNVLVNPDTGDYTIHSLYPGSHSVLFRVMTYTDPATGTQVTPALSHSGYPTKVTMTNSSVTGIDVEMSPGYSTGKFSVTKKPEISGDPLVGKTLSATIGSWTPSASFSYQWLRNGTAIPGETKPTYTVVAEDTGKNLRVSVTGSAEGVANAVVDSNQVNVENTFTTLGATTVSGTPQVGATLSCDPGTYEPSPTSITYKWIRALSYIPGATSSSYVIQPSDAGAQLWCEVTADRGPYPEIRRRSAPVLALREFTSPGAVSISGEATLGNTLTASVSGTNPASSTVAYQWFRNGVEIPSATSPTYTVTAPDALSTLRVTAMVQRAGFTSTSATAAHVSVPKLFASAPAVTITGTADFGRVLTATMPSWRPAATLQYQWLRNGTAIAGAQSSTYTLTMDDQESTIGVRVIGTASSYAPTTRSATLPTAKFFAPTSVPTIDGEPTLGEYLWLNTDAWLPSYHGGTVQWKRDGQPVGANSSYYRVTEADLGTAITVTVVATRYEYADREATSAPVVLPLGTLVPTDSSAVPSISGTVAVGSPVSAVPVSVWPAATSFSYQWFRNGTVIAGATKEKYTPTAGDLGASLKVRVTSIRKGYEQLSLESAPSTVAIGTFATAPAPSISGTLRAGYTLTAIRGTWSPTPTYSYQWYRGGVKITGATNKTYKVATTDRGKQISVKVTGKRAGFTSVAQTSAAKTVLFDFSTTVTPTITGTLKSGYTLTAVRGTWSPTPTYSYQWYRSGAAITKATNKTYKLTTADRGKKITVKVTGKRTGYTTVVKTSTSKSVTK